MDENIHYFGLCGISPVSYTHLCHAFSNQKGMVLITGSFAISIILFLCFTVLITFMHHALNPLKPYAPDLSIQGTQDSVLLDRSLMEEIKALPHMKKIYGRMFYPDIPAHTKQGAGTVTLISYDEPQFQWADTMLVAGKIDHVQKGNGVLVDYKDVYKRQIVYSVDVHYP